MSNIEWILLSVLGLVLAIIFYKWVIPSVIEISMGDSEPDLSD
jgi:hypothetical protein